MRVSFVVSYEGTPERVFNDREGALHYVCNKHKVAPEWEADVFSKTPFEILRFFKDDVQGAGGEAMICITPVAGPEDE